MRDSSLTTLEETKRSLEIPLEDTSQDASLRQLLKEAGLVTERWTRRTLRQREYVETITLANRRLFFSTTLELIIRAIVELLQYLREVEQPAGIAEEEQGLRSFLFNRAEEAFQENPERCVIWSRELAVLETGGKLFCRPVVRWRLTLNEPRLEVVQGVPVLTEMKGRCLTRELGMVFTREAPSSCSERRDVLVEWGGEQERVPLSREMRQLITPFARKRIYLPNKVPTNQDAQVAMKDVFALVCLYLMQEKLISGHEDQPTWEFLCSHFGKFRGATQLGVSSTISEIVGRYQLPEDYRAFRKYIAKTLRGLLAQQSGQDRSYTIPDQSGKADRLMIPAVADRLRIARRTLYHRAKQGQGCVEKVVADNRSYLTIPELEITRLSEEEEQKQLRKALIKAWAKKNEVAIASARRWVERQEKNGLGLKEIGEKIGRKWVEQAVRSLSEDAEDT